MIPLYDAPVPTGIATGTKVLLNLFLRSSRAAGKSALSLSHLLINTNLGLFLLSRFLQSLIVSIWTPVSHPARISAVSQP
jgi:hypothetical protein